MTSTLVRIDKTLYKKLQKHAFNKHKNFRCVKKELDEAVRHYLEQEQEEE